jgi:type IV pilus assembly protein PilB
MEAQAASAGPFPVPGLIPPAKRNGVKRRIGDVIVQLGFAERELVESVVEDGRRAGVPLGQVLIDAGIVNSGQLAQALAERNGLDYVDLNVFEVDKGAASMIDGAKARRYRTIPIAFLAERTLLVATADPANLLALDDITMVTGFEVRRAVASPEDIDALIENLGTLESSVHEIDDDEVDAQVIELRESADDAPVVKIMAELDIAEKRMPQDGRIGLSVDGSYVDLRVATLPVVRGESVVMRILDSRQMVMNLDNLGMEDADRARFEAAIGTTHGAILVTGPTGSGKTTTLYAGMAELNTPDRTIVSVEDPVEYELEGVKQIQVNSKTGLTFATGLRAMVRADPDVIMVGEIRDTATAQIAIEAALTGHFVMTTLHANGAPLAAARLIDMGIEPFLVTSSVECVVAQRLVRRLCECKLPVKLTKHVLAENGFHEARGFTAYEPGACVRCGQSGYKGRTGVYEVMTMTDSLRRLILAKASQDELRAKAREQGMRTLREDGLEKVRHGITSIPEVLRVVGSIDS